MPENPVPDVGARSVSEAQPSLTRPARNVRYEKSDAQITGILAFGAGLLLLGLVIHVAVAWLFDAFRDSARRDDVPLSPLAAKERTQLPRDLSKLPPPVLQQDEAADLARWRAREDERLKSYGWIDAEAGIVHIPIAEAMRILAAKNKGGR